MAIPDRTELERQKAVNGLHARTRLWLGAGLPMPTDLKGKETEPPKGFLTHPLLVWGSIAPYQIVQGRTSYVLGLPTELRDQAERGIVSHDEAMISFANLSPRAIIRPVSVSTGCPLSEQHYRLMLDAFFTLVVKADELSVEDAIAHPPKVSYSRTELREATGCNTMQTTAKRDKAGVQDLDEAGNPVLCKGALQTAYDLKGIRLSQATVTEQMGRVHARSFALPGVDEIGIYGDTYIGPLNEETILQVGDMKLKNGHIVLVYDSKMMAYAKGYALLIRYKARMHGISDQVHLMAGLKRLFRDASPLMARAMLWNLNAPETSSVQSYVDSNHPFIRDILGVAPDASLSNLRKAIKTAISRAFGGTDKEAAPHGIPSAKEVLALAAKLSRAQ